MTDPIDRREPRGHAVKAALVLIAISGMVLRLAPLFRAGGPIAHPIDYDEGVYFAASALLFRGVLPYRDFVFVHPPGLLYSLGVTSIFTAVVDAAAAFAASRVVATAVGALNIFVVGCIAYRWTRMIGAAMLAAALYATYPEVVVVERGPFLEPVLNLLCLSAAYLWLVPHISQVRDRRIYAAGALAGAATAVKVWGGIWLLAALASAPADHRRRTLSRFAVSAAIAGFVLMMPLAVAAPENFVTDVLPFHAWRPDGFRILEPIQRKFWQQARPFSRPMARRGRAIPRRNGRIQESRRAT
jgi:4-amino-4-deoxy-L-arabinose transferase-like glycosyltransferase